MTAHERVLELGAAAFDFRLTPAERDDLDRHLAACTQCRSDLDGMAHDVRRLESRPARRMPPDAAAAVRARLERPRRAMSPAMVLVAAALLILATLVTLAVGAEIQRRLDESRLAVEPAPPSVPAASALPVPTPVVPTAWTLTALGATPGIPFQATAVARSELGWIAITGRTCTETGEWTFDCVASVARSSDGRAWSPSGTFPIATGYVPPMSGPEVGIHEVAAGDDGYVAIGYAWDGPGLTPDGNPVMAAPRGAAWWSADGVTWERALLEGGSRPAAVFRAADRWLIGGVVYRGLDVVSDHPIGAIWTSTDGRTWSRTEDDTVFDVGGYVDTMEDPGAGGIGAFASDGEAIVAGGQVCAEGGMPCASAAWVSADGKNWGRVENVPAGDAIVDVEAVNGTFVAAARRCPVSGDCATLLLHSADGRVWEAVPGELWQSPTMASSRGMVVILTGEYRELDVQASADGVVWQRLGTVPAPERVNWGEPVLVPRADGRIDLLIRIDPLTEPDTEADVWTALWEIAPTP